MSIQEKKVIIVEGRTDKDKVTKILDEEVEQTVLLT